MPTNALGTTTICIWGSGTFPTVATANPTLTLAALTLRTVEKIEKALN
jgi:glucose dehydrogenase